jgi:hypothetical protein
MFDDADWSRPEDVERVRRSVAMLSPGVNALRREPALAVLTALVDSLRGQPIN